MRTNLLKYNKKTEWFARSFNTAEILANSFYIESNILNSIARSIHNINNKNKMKTYYSYLINVALTQLASVFFMPATSNRSLLRHLPSSQNTSATLARLFHVEFANFRPLFQDTDRGRAGRWRLKQIRSTPGHF